MYTSHYNGYSKKRNNAGRLHGAMERPSRRNQQRKGMRS